MHTCKHILKWYSHIIYISYTYTCTQVLTIILTHAHTYSQSHTNTSMYMHSHIYSWWHSHLHVHVCTHVCSGHPHMCKHTCAYIHVLTHAHNHTWTGMCSHLCSMSFTHAHVYFGHTCAYMYSLSYTHTSTHLHSHTHSRAHIHTVVGMIQGRAVRQSSPNHDREARAGGGSWGQQGRKQMLVAVGLALWAESPAQTHLSLCLRNNWRCFGDFRIKGLSDSQHLGQSLDLISVITILRPWGQWLGLSSSHTLDRKSFNRRWHSQAWKTN